MRQALLPERGPGRLMYWATLVNTTGTGMYVASSAIFFVHYIGMPSSRVGLGLSVGGLLGITVGIPVGHLADRRGPRLVYLTALLTEAAGMCALVFVREFWQFVAVTTLASLAATSTAVARGPMVRAIATGRPAELRAHLRSVANIGITLGGGAAGVVIALDRRPLYPLLLLGNALSFVICALLVRRLPEVAPKPPRGPKDRVRALSDVPYLGLTGVTAVMMLQYAVLPLVLPLWILSHTGIPHWLTATSIPINTLMVATLQVRVSRGVDTPSAAARMMIRAGLALLASFALMACLSSLPVAAASLLLPIAVIIYTLGELYYGTAGYELSFSMAPAAAQGRYLGVYSMGAGLGRVVSPAVVSAFCLDVGWPGWILLGALMLAAGLATPVLARRSVVGQEMEVKAGETEGAGAVPG